jgi:hypothetical protein
MQERPLEPVREVEHRVVDHRDYEECGGRKEEAPDDEDEQTRIVPVPSGPSRTTRTERGARSWRLCTVVLHRRVEGAAIRAACAPAAGNARRERRDSCLLRAAVTSWPIPAAPPRGGE